MSLTLDRAAASPIERERRNYASLPEVLPLPNLIQTQIDSFKWFCDEGLGELFKEISPIQDFTGKNLDLRFLGSEFREPKYSEEECRTRDLTFSKPLWARVELVNKETGEVSEQDVFLGDFPWMTDKGTFVINGAERVVVSQLVRSPGVYFTAVDDPTTGRRLFYAKLIPNRGAWLDLEMSQRTLTNDDLVRIVGRMIELNNGKGHPDDIDHLGNRRVRAVGELIQQQFRVGLLRMERVVRERMSIVEPEKATPKELINIRPVVAAIKEFFGGSQLSQFMQQTNPLDELTPK